MAAFDHHDLLIDLPDGDWVAVSESQRKVLAHGPDARAVLAEARDGGETLPLIVRVHDEAMPMFVTMGGVQ